jgi:hypothetical protein
VVIVRWWPGVTASRPTTWPARQRIVQEPAARQEVGQLHVAADRSGSWLCKLVVGSPSQGQAPQGYGHGRLVGGHFV